MRPLSNARPPRPGGTGGSSSGSAWKFRDDRPVSSGSRSSYHVGRQTDRQIHKRTLLKTRCSARAQQTPSPCWASRGFSELTQNWIRSSHGQSAPSLKISCKSVQLFSRNLANKETNKDTNKQTNKEIDRKQYPVPRSIGDGVTIAPSLV